VFIFIKKYLTYVAKANIGSESLSANFEITAGQARDILLGN
jgi:hypothetical protein